MFLSALLNYWMILRVLLYGHIYLRLRTIATLTLYARNNRKRVCKSISYRNEIRNRSSEAYPKNIVQFRAAFKETFYPRPIRLSQNTWSQNLRSCCNGSNSRVVEITPRSISNDCLCWQNRLVELELPNEQWNRLFKLETEWLIYGESFPSQNLVLLLQGDKGKTILIRLV